jgi:hypothetical protein
MNPMNGCSANSGDVHTICRLRCSMATVVNVHLQEFCGGVRACPEGDICDLDEVLYRVLWQRDGVVHKVLCEIPGGLCDSAEKPWAFYPSHLHCCWNDDADGFPRFLRENICKIEAVNLMYYQLPKTVTDVQFAEKDVESSRGVSRILEKLGEYFTNFFNWN